MAANDRLADMAQLAAILSERALAELRQSQQRREQIEAQLALLDQTGLSQGLDPVLAGQVEERYGLWVLNRRIALNRSLAQEMVKWINARDRAKLAFGRAEVLGKLSRDERLR